MKKLAGALVLLACTRALVAQDTGAVTGKAVDPSGAVLPGVTVTAVSPTTGVATQTVTAGDGTYMLPSLRIGVYTVSAELVGFKKEVRAGIELHIQERLKVVFQLQVGQISDEVVVTSQAPLLETETSNLGQVVAHDTIENLPLNGRNFIQLALLSAGALPSYKTAQRDNFVANGNRPIQNSYILDGRETSRPRAIRRVSSSRFSTRSPLPIHSPTGG